MSIPWRWIIGLVGIGMLLVVIFIPADDSTANGPIGVLLHDLRSSSSVRHQNALRRLVHLGRGVIPALSREICADPENSEPFFAVLEELLISENELASEAAESELEHLRDLSFRHADLKPIGGHVHKILSEHAELRQSRAERALLAHQAKFIKLPKTPSGNEFFLLLLDENWTGGEEHLKWIPRISTGQLRHVHLARAAEISSAAVRKLRGRLQENIAIRQEGAGCLGLSTANALGRIQVYRMQRDDPRSLGSPAWLTGIRTGMFIEEIDGLRPVNSLHFQELLSQREVGETVTLKLRDFNRQTTKEFRVVLGNDFGTGVCSCLDRNQQLELAYPPAPLEPVPDESMAATR